MNPELKAFFYDKTNLGLILACILGIWMGFPNDFLNFPLAVFFWPLALVYLGYYSTSLRIALFSGWLATFSGACLTLYWLCFPVRDVGDLPWILAILCAVVICACLAVQGAVFCAFCRYLSPFFNIFSAILIALAWYLLEYIYAMCAGFPWLAISGALAQWPLILQFADTSGAFLCSALWLLGILCIFFCLQASKAKVSLFRFLAGFCLIIFLCAYGLFRSVDSSDGKLINALFVEGNIDQNQKWVPAFQKKSLDTYLELSREGVVEARKNGIEQPLIIWPETALPFFLETRPTLASEVYTLVRSLNCPLLFGAPGLERSVAAPAGLVYNRAYLLNPDGQKIGYYEKEHLVPFGEYLPEWLNFGFLRSLLQGVGVYQTGVATKPLIYESLALGILICYEGIFPWLAQERVKAGANILVDISNDGWFRDSPASRQHLYLTSSRCIEQNRWLLRSTNTGISAVIDNRGRIVLAGPMFQAGYIEAKGRLLEEHSRFYYLEAWLPGGCFLLFCILIITHIVHEKKIRLEKI